MVKKERSAVVLSMRSQSADLADGAAKSIAGESSKATDIHAEDTTTLAKAPILALLI